MKEVVPGLAMLLLVLCPALRHASGQAALPAVAGVVCDRHGTPQMGALIELLDVNAAVVAHTFTDDHGRYLLSAAVPGRYQVRASSAFLSPAMRSNVRLGAGAHALANLTLSTLFDASAWFPAQRRSADEPGDDWRWTLRSSANRPLLRLSENSDGDEVEDQLDRPNAPASVTHVSALAGSGGFADAGVRQNITETIVRPNGWTETLHVSVGVPDGAGISPAMKAKSDYGHHAAFGGDMKMVAGLEVHPEIAGAGATGLQVLTLATSERMALGDAVMIDAGTLLSAERLVASRVSAAPFLRIVVNPAPGFAVLYRFAAGQSLQSADDADGAELAPKVLSDAQGRPVMTNGLHQELAVSHAHGGTTETVAVYQDDLPVAGLEGMGPLRAGEAAGLPLLQDRNSGSFRLAVGGYTARGVSVAWTHEVTATLAACAQVEFGTALKSGNGTLALSHVQSAVRPSDAVAVRVGMRGRVAHTGTAFQTQYRWQPRETLTAVDSYNVAAEQAYLGVSLRQRLWSGHRLQGLEAVLEASNLLEEGYRPVIGSDGETLYLAQAPRTVQAGLAFTF